ncbi:hypothetical protein [Caulobacter sp. Root487D2Y]|uniref:hypothetical protein n=1 Tax=Caulobacter sp. Root487D2Y TaxID=1736547 RepID=UPI000B249C6D|nr:hypothetical protein [Caulobacter sp. Root487D2Y]
MKRAVVGIVAIMTLVGCERPAEMKKLAPVAPKKEATKNEWRVIWKDKGVWLAINEKIDTVNGFKRVWYGSVRSKAGEQPVISNSLTEYDCKNRSSRQLQEYGYTADGRPEKFEVFKNPEWSYPAPDTVAFGVMAFSCEGVPIEREGTKHGGSFETYASLGKAQAALAASEKSPVKKPG